jgi:hypothetical protein
MPGRFTTTFAAVLRLRQSKFREVAGTRPGEAQALVLRLTHAAHPHRIVGAVNRMETPTCPNVEVGGNSSAGG